MPSKWLDSILAVVYTSAGVLDHSNGPYVAFTWVFIGVRFRKQLSDRTARECNKRSCKEAMSKASRGTGQKSNVQIPARDFVLERL